MRNKTIVLDTNVLVSAALSPSKLSAQIVQKVILGELTLVVCPSIVNEYKEVFALPKFKRWKFPPQWFEFLLSNARVVAFDPDVSELRGPDSDDFVFLALAKEEGAVLATGNIKDYPTQHRQSVAVLTPADFLAQL